MGNRLIDLTGRKFGKLIVICRSKEIYSHGGTYWDCICECGEKKTLRTDVLRKTDIQSCGCESNNIKIGHRVGSLVVVERVGRVSSRCVRWKCKCDCGNEKTFTTSTIKIGNTRSCGCLLNPNGKRHPNFVGYEDMSGNFFNRIKNGAEFRKIPFKISMKQIWDLFEEQNRKCALSGMSLKFGVNSRIKEKKRECTASLDRIDNTKGYVKGNIQWLHKDVNKMKNTHSQKYFLDLCKKIAVKY